MRVLCIGMMVCDTLISPVPDRILELDSVRIRTPQVCCGGDALNVALGLARLNCPVSIAGRIGNDANGKFILDECRRHGVDTERVIFDPECGTAASYALIDERGERHFLTEKTVFYRLEGADVSEEALGEADAVYIGSAMSFPKMDEGGIAEVFGRAHRQGKMTLMDAAVNMEDPDRDWMELLGPAFRETDVFFPSLKEAEQLTGETDPEKIADAFRTFGMKLFGVKLGGRGSFVTDFRESRYIGCPSGMPVVDTTGAGDSFMAGLTCALTRGFPPFEAVRFASCVATRNVGAVGGTAGIPDYEEALRFYQEWKDRL
ncbi:MAG: carbohydrate kinase family protein [Eubacteriales bacterium]|nr:carbohydrate kinase family protein [Eubacteriales bacterium]